MRVLLVCLIFLIPSLAQAQAVRMGDNYPITTYTAVDGFLSVGSYATVTVCNSPNVGVPCTNKATTYTSATAGTSCPTSTQITLAGTNTCVGTADVGGAWGVWVTPGTYTYTITINGASAGPFTVNLSTGGSGTPGGTSGQIQYNNSFSFGGFTLGGDCSLTIPSIICTKTNGVNFSASATTDTTNASNISSGTLNSARLPVIASCTYGGSSLTSPGTCNFSNSGFISWSNPSTNNLAASLTNTGGGGATIPLCNIGSGTPGDVFAFNASSICTETTLGIPQVSVTSSPVGITTSQRGYMFQLGSGASALTVPQAGSTGFLANFDTSSIWNLSGGTVTLTPTTSTIRGGSGNAASGSSSVNILNNDLCTGLLSNPTGSGTYTLPCVDTVLLAPGPIGSTTPNSGAFSLLNSVVVLTPATAGTHWTDKLVTAYGASQCSSGCTIQIPDSVADDGSATTPNIPSNVTVDFTGSATFTFCSIELQPLTKIFNKSALLQMKSGSSGCVGLNQPNGTESLQSVDMSILENVKIDCNSTTNSVGMFEATVYGRRDNLSIGNCTTAGLSILGSQFGNWVNLKTWNDYVGVKLYEASFGGANSNTFTNLVSTNNTVGFIQWDESGLGTYGNYCINCQFINNSIAGVAVVGVSGTDFHMVQGTTETTGNSGSTVTVDGNVIKNAGLFANTNARLYLNNVYDNETSVTNWVIVNNSSTVVMADVFGGGNSGATINLTDSTSESIIEGSANFLFTTLCGGTGTCLQSFLNYNGGASSSLRPVGSASLPAYSFAGHPTYGMWYNGGALQFQLGSGNCQIDSSTDFACGGNFAAGSGSAFYWGGSDSLRDSGGVISANTIFNSATAYTVTPIAVASLPAAASGNKGQVRVVSDSTTVIAEGQTCAGSSTNTALAFSNGSVWKCF